VQDPSGMLESLCNPAAKLQNIFPPYAAFYQEDLRDAKLTKIEEAVNRVFQLDCVVLSY
jgi:hypothetical protein